MATLQTCVADSNRSLEEIERGSYVVLDDGSYAQLIIEVGPGDELTCAADINRSTSSIRKGSFVRVNDTQWAKQVVPVT